MPFGSDILAVLRVPIVGDTSALDRSLALVRSRLSGFLALGGFAAVGLGLGFVAKTAISLEQALTNLDQVTDLTREELTSLGENLEQLAVQLKTVPVAKLYEIATAGAKLGYAGDVLLDYTKGIVNATSVIKELPVAQLADDLGRLNNQFKLGVKGSEQMASAIGKVASSGTSAPDQILEIGSRISGLATVAKITGPQVIALAGTIADSTKHSEAAAGALIALIQNLNVVESQKGFAKTIGVSAQEFADQVHNEPIEAIKDFLGALKNLDAESQGIALESIGIEGIRGLGNLEKLSQSFQDIGRYEKIANEEFATTAFLQRASAKDMATSGAAVSQLGIQFTIAAKKVGDLLTPAIRYLAESLTSFLAQVAPKIPELGEAFRTLGQALLASQTGQWAAGVARSFGSNLPTAAGFMDTLIVTVRNFDLIFGETQARVAAGTTNIVNYVGLMKDLVVLSFNGIVSDIGSGFQLIIEAAKISIDFVGQVIENGLILIYDSFVNLYNDAQPIFDFLFRPLIDAADRAVREVGRILNILQAIGKIDLSKPLEIGKEIGRIYAASGIGAPGSSGIRVPKPLELKPIKPLTIRTPDTIPDFSGLSTAFGEGLKKIFEFEFDDAGPAIAALQAQAQERNEKALAERLARERAGKTTGGGTGGAQGGEAGGTGKLPGGAQGEGVGQTFELAAFAKRLQEGVFGKDTDAAKTAKNTDKMAGGITELVRAGKQPQRVTPAVV